MILRHNRPFWTARVYRPLLSFRAARPLLRGDYTTEALLALCENGKLPWVFNIATARSSRKELRILARSLGEFQRWGRGEWRCRLDRVIDEIVGPPLITTIRGTDLQILLDCDSGHIMHLAKEKSIEQVQAPELQTGPYSSPMFRRSSVVRFLKKRRFR